MKSQYLILIIFLLLNTLTGCEKDKSELDSYSIDSNDSKVEWKGSAADHFHLGSFSVAGDFTTDENGLLKNGNFIIPVGSIENYDLPDDQKVLLLTDLKGPDFFNIALYPNANFRITSVASYKGTDPSAVEGANYLITGDFSMIGQTHELSFPARIYTDDDGLHTIASFRLNRLKWGMTSYNDPDEVLYLLPDVEIKLNINSTRK